MYSTSVSFMLRSLSNFAVTAIITKKQASKASNKPQIADTTNNTQDSDTNLFSSFPTEITTQELLWRKIHTIRKVKFLSENSILTNPQHFHVFFTQKIRQLSRQIKVEFLDKKWRFRTVWYRVFQQVWGPKIDHSFNKKTWGSSPAVKKKSFERCKLFEKSLKMGSKWNMFKRSKTDTILCIFVASFWHYFFIIMMLCRRFLCSSAFPKVIYIIATVTNGNCKSSSRIPHSFIDQHKIHTVANRVKNSKSMHKSIKYPKILGTYREPTHTKI